MSKEIADCKLRQKHLLSVKLVKIVDILREDGFHRTTYAPGEEKIMGRRRSEWKDWLLRIEHPILAEEGQSSLGPIRPPIQRLPGFFPGGKAAGA
jgi:hypothetical protein